MSLADWQRQLAELVVDASARPAQDEWIAGLAKTRGLAVTRAIQQWWREQRLAAGAPLTFGIVPGELWDRLLVDYLKRVPAHTMHAFAEARHFLGYLLDSAGSDVSPHVLAVARFERARIAVALGATQLHRIRFRGDAYAILAAAMSGNEPPAPGASADTVVHVGANCDRGFEVHACQALTDEATA